MTIIIRAPPSIHRPILLAISATFLFFLSLCQAELVNLTIDDSFGDQTTGFEPIYNPSGLPWSNHTCSTCAIQPDPSKTFRGTWTSSTSDPALKDMFIDLEFTGVAIWVFFILANANSNATNCFFTLDGSNAGSFIHTPDTRAPDLIYDATVFSATNLSNVAHRLFIMINGTAPFYTNFDYAIYTAVRPDAVTSPATSSASTLTGSSMKLFDSTTSKSTLVPTPESPNRPNSIRPPQAVGPIVGPVLGSLTVIVVLFLFLCRRCSKPRAKHSPLTNSLFSVASSQLPARDTSFSRSSEGKTTGQEPVTATDRKRRPAVRQEPVTPTNRKRPLPSTTRAPLAPRITKRQVREELRAARQMEIDRRLESAQREMANLASGQNLLQQGIESEVPAERAQEMDALRAQVSVLRSHIEQLEAERQSEAMDLLPPAYYTQ